ncbi:hypothetical protein ACH5RR_014633 [Cinchona calisaya]|uniref:Transmembrane protein n=1 Tax=Cinchona calisaya TaxID=153742 RepID=A0ABD2ZQW1_9GENT
MEPVVVENPLRGESKNRFLVSSCCSAIGRGEMVVVVLGLKAFFVLFDAFCYLKFWYCCCITYETIYHFFHRPSTAKDFDEVARCHKVKEEVVLLKMDQEEEERVGFGMPMGMGIGDGYVYGYGFGLEL